MSESELYKGTKKHIRDRIQTLCELVDKASSMPHMTSNDIDHARAAADAIKYGERSFFEVLDELHKTDPALALNMAWAVDNLTGGVAVAANKATLSESSLNAAAYKQAQDARLARQNSPQEIALNEAIKKALNGRDPSKRGVAGQILNTVNQVLIAAGHDAVLRDTVGRRLKKLRS